MCGICCICSLSAASVDEQCPFLNMEYVESHSFSPCRGPDWKKSLTCKLGSGIQALFAGFVLHLRGTLTPQPLTNDDGDILLWNGEIFGGIQVKDDENDTQVLFQQLTRCESQQDILRVIQSIHGPWSLIFWQAKEERLWFGRDVFGRRSLVWHLPQDDDVFALSSVPITPLDFTEVPSVGMFCMELSQPPADSQDVSQGTDAQPVNHPLLNLHLYPWQRATWPGTEEEVLVDDRDAVAQKLHLHLNGYISVCAHSDHSLSSWMPVLNREVPDAGSLLEVDDCMSGGGGDLAQVMVEVEKRGEMMALVTQLQNVLLTAVRKRVLNLPPSSATNGGCPQGDPQACGGDENLDTHCVCDSLAKLHAHSQVQQPSAQSSDSDVSQNISSNCCLVQADQQTGVLEDRNQTETLRSSTCDSDSTESDSEGKKCLSKREQTSLQSSDKTTVTGVDRGACSQTTSLQSSDKTTMTSEDRGACSQTYTKPARVAILFSGGVDSTVLAAVADRCVPGEEAIDLINVAFEQKVSAPQPKKNTGNQAKPAAMAASHYNVPDRQTGYVALSELNPHRCWNFVEVNVTQEMLQKERCERVRHLVYPLKTVLDDSIGCAVWFAARGSGVLGNGPRKGAPYTSTAKVILCGMGADEQLAGYSRHRVRFQQGSWTGLIAEINMEIHRISARNLGRDDRVIADHGKEARFPFLDEDVVAFLASLPIHHKADLRFPRGVGEKLVLRLLAGQLGLPCTSALPKRAIQFGSRIAKLEQSKEKGNQVCQRLTQD